MNAYIHEDVIGYDYDHEKHVNHHVANNINAYKRVFYSEDGRGVSIGYTRTFFINDQSEERYISEFNDAFALQLYDEWGAYEDMGEDNYDDMQYLCRGNLH